MRPALPVPAPPGPGEVHVWLARKGDLPAGGTATGDPAPLVARRRLLAVVAGAYLGLPEDRVAVDRSAGRPVLVDAPHLGVSVSDSGDLLAVALAGAEVGIDLEEGTRVRRIDRMIARVLSPAEREEVEAAAAAAAGDPAVESAAAGDGRGAGADRAVRQAFLRCWTRKEAVLKSFGRGLSVELSSLDVGAGVQPRTPPTLAGEALADRRLVTLPLEAPHVGSACVVAGAVVVSRLLTRPAEVLSSTGTR